MSVELWEHQREALRRAAGKKSYALFFEQGCGKTATAIHMYRQKCEEAGRQLRSFVFCPPIVVSNWLNEIPRYMVGAEKGTAVALVGSGVERETTVRFALQGRINPSIFVTNYEALQMKKLVSLITEWKPDMLILDESHKVKDPSSKRTKVLTELAKDIPYKILMSGTPFPNSLFDVFAQYRILDGGETFGENFFRFRDEFFVNLNANASRRISYPNWQPKKGAEEEIQKRIAPSAMRVTKLECLTLPPLVRQYVDVVLSGEQRKVYEQFQRTGVARIDDSKVASADLAITKALRLQQVASGFLQLDDGTTHKFVPNVRATVLSELIESLPLRSKFIIWAVYRENYEDIRRVLRNHGLQYVELTGETPSGLRSELAEKFRRDDNVRALIGNPVAAGIGINLVEAEYAIFYSRSFSLEADLQAEARNHRGGSEIHKSVTRIDLVAPGTVDEVVLEALKNKQDVQSAVLESLNKE